MNIQALWEKNVLDEILNSELTEIVAGEVSQDAREKNEKIKQLEDAVLRQRSSYLKLKKRRDDLGSMLEVAERRLIELKALAENVLNHEVSPSEIKSKLKAIFS